MTTPWAGGVAVIAEAEKWLRTFGTEAFFSGSGQLTATLTGYKDLSADFSGAGTLDARLADYRRLAAAMSGEGSLDARMVGITKLTAAFSGEGRLSASTRPPTMGSFGGEGTLEATLSGYRRIDAAFDSEGVLVTELVYSLAPVPLDLAPLGRLTRYSVTSSAVPLNPAEGSGSVPSVNPSFIAGADPEFMLGQTVEVKNDSIGYYKGEAVRVSISEASDEVALSTNTLLTLANKDLHLAPFIDPNPGHWTALRAIDYWTQQAGIFYDEVPGSVAFYASGYGHGLAYAGDNDTRRCYEKTTAEAGVSFLNNRSVRLFGDSATATAAMHDFPEARVPLMLGLRQKLVFSLGVGLRGSGRTASAEWVLKDGAGLQYTLSITVTSAGLVTARLGGLTLVSTELEPDSTCRITASLERSSASTVVGKLTVHTDNAAGTGVLVRNLGPTRAISYKLPGVLNLAAVRHTSAGGSGPQMLRWGTYLSVAKDHPMDLPAVRKVFSETPKTLGYVSGFTGNVWNMLAEFCSIHRLDIRSHEGRMVVEPRSSAVISSGLKFSRMEKDSSRREKYKQVAVVNRQSKAVANGTAVLWRADSVYQLNTREVFETTVQTEHSILSVANPVPVPGINPYPYTAGAGQYVVTGADGYIIAPQWWLDHGGKVEVSLTEKEGEIRLKLTAPEVDSVRAPYRISEGAADRPALYISGSGIINDPKELHIATGATKAREGFDRVFTSPFIAGAQEAYDVASKMAREYSTAMSDVSCEVPTDFNTPSAFGQYPAGKVFTDNDRNYRLQEVTQTHSRVSSQAVPHTTIAAYKASYPAGSTIADEKARHRGRTIREFNIKPLRRDS
jgi:hypothetical protein